jgi:hypothetical protein
MRKCCKNENEIYKIKMLEKKLKNDKKYKNKKTN